MDNKVLLLLMSRGLQAFQIYCDFEGIIFKMELFTFMTILKLILVTVKIIIYGIYLYYYYIILK